MVSKIFEFNVGKDLKELRRIVGLLMTESFKNQPDWDFIKACGLDLECLGLVGQSHSIQAQELDKLDHREGLLEALERREIKGE